MLTSYLKIALRNLLKNKVYSFINIFGLAVGLSACIFIYQYAAFELSYDKFYQDADRIYRITYHKYLGEKETENLAKSPEALAAALIAEVPEVEMVSRLSPAGNVTVTTKTSGKFSENKVFIADPSFVTMFPPVMLAGSAKGGGILLSESVAYKYFGTSDAVDQVISIYSDKTIVYKIIGVFKDLPANTHFDFNVLFVRNENNKDLSWQYTGFYTYVKLKQGASNEQFGNKVNAIAQTQAKSDFNISVYLPLQALTDIHLHSDLKEEMKVNGNYSSLMFLILTGCVILFLAWLNYVNLSIVKSTERLKEIGVRKVIGSKRSDLISQFLMESALYNFISVFLALGIAGIFSDYFNQLCGKELLFTELLYDNTFWLGIFTVASIGVLVTSLYPAFLYSGFKPIHALKGIMNIKANDKISFKGALLVFQFSITAFLIVGMLIVYKQMDFMRNSDLGIDIKRILVVKSPNIQKEHWSDKLISYTIDSSYFHKIRMFNDRLSSYNSFRVASISHTPGTEVSWGTEGYRREDDPNSLTALYMAGVDDAFFPVFKIRFLAGRNFTLNRRGDQLNTVILNRAATKALGFQSPESAVGKNMVYLNSKKEIIGVVEDYHQESLKRAIKPTFYQLLPRALDYFAVSIPSGKMSSSIVFIKEQWSAVFGDNPFEYFFLDDFFNQQYKEDQRFQQAFNAFASLSIFIACIGLFGMSSYLIIQRTKEIGIRKILGASLLNILSLLSGFYMKLVLISSLIAAPLSYFALSNWLKNFAFRIDIQLWMVLLPLLAIPVITFLTISFQSIKSSLADPLQSLRSE